MDVGSLKHRISIYTTVSTQDSGGLTQTRSLLFETWAKIVPLNQARSLDYGLIENFKNYEITIRYRSTVTPKQTIDWDSKTLTITSVLNTDANLKELKLICTEND